MSYDHRHAPHEDPLDPSDDYRSHGSELRERMARARFLIASMNRRELTEAEKEELPQLTTDLRRLLRVQLAWNGRIARLDAEDGSYDNAEIDNALRLQMARLRDKNIDLRRMWGTRTVRKVSAWLFEDLPNWMTVKWRQLKDNLWQFTKVAAVAGLVGGGAALGGYALAYGGLGAGLSAMGQHLSKYAIAPALGGLGSLWGKIWGTKAA